MNLPLRYCLWTQMSGLNMRSETGHRLMFNMIGWWNLVSAPMKIHEAVFFEEERRAEPSFLLSVHQDLAALFPLNLQQLDEKVESADFKLGGINHCSHAHTHRHTEHRVCVCV